LIEGADLELDDQILAFYVSELPQTLSELVDPELERLARAEEADPVDRSRRLHLGGERRGERRGKQRGSTSKERTALHHSIT
jgi:hypothetical protein